MVTVTAPPDLTTQAGRLRYARQRKHSSMRGAAIANGWNENTYKSHELGIRRDGALPEEDAKRYARAFGVSVQWLLSGRGKPEGDQSKGNTVPLVGYVGAGDAAHFYAESDELDYVDAPPGMPGVKAAAAIKGPSLGPIFDGWLVFWGERRAGVPTDFYGKLCMVWLPDDRVLVKQIQPSRHPGFFHLISNNEAPMMDEEVLWSAVVDDMRPR